MGKGVFSFRVFNSDIGNGLKEASGSIWINLPQIVSRCFKSRRGKYFIFYKICLSSVCGGRYKERILSHTKVLSSGSQKDETAGSGIFGPNSSKLYEFIRQFFYCFIENPTCRLSYTRLWRTAGSNIRAIKSSMQRNFPNNNPKTSWAIQGPQVPLGRTAS